MPLRPTFLYGQGAGQNIPWTVSYPPAIASQDLGSHHVARESYGSPYLRYSLVRNRREPASHELKDDPQDHRDCILDPHPLESSSRGREFPPPSRRHKGFQRVPTLRFLRPDTWPSRSTRCESSDSLPVTVAKNCSIGKRPVPLGVKN